MAKSAKKIAIERGGPERQALVRVRIEPSPDGPIIYCNAVEIGHNQHEFSLFFARLPAKASREQMDAAEKTAVLELSPEAHILLPPTVIKPLIDALQSQLDTYNKERQTIDAKEASKS